MFPNIASRDDLGIREREVDVKRALWRGEDKTAGFEIEGGGLDLFVGLDGKWR